ECGSPAVAFLLFGDDVGRSWYIVSAQNPAGEFVLEMENQMNRVLLTLFAMLALACSVSAQSSEKPPAAEQQAPSQAAPAAPASAPAARPEDVKSIDSILSALYGVISGPVGERDWNRFRSLFLPQARLTAATKNADGSARVR